MATTEPAADTPPGALLRRAVHRHRAGAEEEAETLYRQVIAAEPDNADALALLGRLLLTRGQGDQAVALLDRAVAAEPAVLAFRADRADLLTATGRPDEAVADWRAFIRARPEDARGHLGYGIAMLKQARPAEAVAALRRACGLTPDSPVCWDRLAVALARTGDTDGADKAFARAHVLAPDDSRILSRWGRALYRAGRSTAAALQFRAAIDRNPADAEALTGLGAALIDQGRPDRALEPLQDAIACAPESVSARNNLGLALIKTGRLDQAERHLVRARATAQTHQAADILNNLGNLKLEQGRIAEALAFYDQAMKSAPVDPQAYINLLAQAGRIYDWDTQDRLIGHLPERLSKAAEAGAGRSFMPLAFTLPYFCADRALINRVLTTVGNSFTRRRWADDGRDRSPDRRLKIGYLSPDFGDHPISHVTLPIYRAHDRRAVEIHCYATLNRAAAGGHYLDAIKSSADRFIDISRASFAEAAARIRADGIDILIDMTGYMRHAKPQILAESPAPLQVYWQGHTGTLGGPLADYVIGDAVVMPPAEDRYFSEAVVRLPGSFSPADRHAIDDRALSRSDCGLPEGVVVFCAFNNPLKIDRTTFLAWSRILRAVPDSRLWLTAPGDPAGEARLRAAAEALGLAPDRLVFAPRIADKSVHLARHRPADLFLDSLHFNASTTALDALWAGLPVLTRRGQTPYARLAASYLTSLGMTELICDNPERYEAEAIRLAGDADARSRLRRRLAKAVARSPLFDGARFTRGLERAYRTMWQRFCQGEPPASFTVETGAPAR